MSIVLPASTAPEDENHVNSARSNGRYLTFGPYQLDRVCRQLSWGESNLQLKGKTYELLVVLGEHCGELVPRDELRTRLWPHLANTKLDTNLNTTVNKLRGILDSFSDGMLTIQTVRSVVYPLILAPSSTHRRWVIRGAVWLFAYSLVVLLAGAARASAWPFSHRHS